MTSSYRLIFLYSLISALGLGLTIPCLKSANADTPGCPTSALSRFQRHKVARGETLESIAQRYNLIPATIIGMNPSLQNGQVVVGREIQIPPYNGIVIEVPRGQTWRDVAAKYRIRADALFEINGCQTSPKIVFVPGVNFSQNRSANNYPTSAAVAAASPTTTTTTSKLAGYPLPEVTTVALPYGWQANPITGEVFFNSGLDLIGQVGTPVQAIGDGKVVFASEQGTYGNLVIINHSGGLQSRYAHLDVIKVAVNQNVKQGDLLGTVGTTGKPNSNQPHLHFEVRSSSSLGWVAQDPTGYLKR